MSPSATSCPHVKVRRDVPVLGLTVQRLCGVSTADVQNLPASVADPHDSWCRRHAEHTHAGPIDRWELDSNTHAQIGPDATVQQGALYTRMYRTYQPREPRRRRPSARSRPSRCGRPSGCSPPWRSGRSELTRVDGSASVSGTWAKASGEQLLGDRLMRLNWHEEIDPETGLAQHHCMNDALGRQPAQRVVERLHPTQGRPEPPRNPGRFMQLVAVV